MSDRHATPLDVARVLARHAPRHISSILEPAVGTGVLLRPLVSRLINSAKKIVCVDSDPDALAIVADKLGSILGQALELVTDDFLIWSGKLLDQKNALFDCVLMNPPFRGRRASHVRIELPKSLLKSADRSGYVPVEVAFVLRGVELLKPGGRLLAIVPSSLISSSETGWVRQYLLSTGYVRFVHELPRFTFKDVEARVYLFVFEKDTPQGNLTLCNHDLHKPEKMIVSKSGIGPNARFDFSYNQAHSWLQRVRLRVPLLLWTGLKNVADLLRGSENSPDGPKEAIHTCDWREGFWQPRKDRVRLKKGKSERHVKEGDLLLKRVGRNCVSSLGLVIGHINYACSDCIFLMRPSGSLGTYQLLFAVRILLACSEGASLVERGTGASYLTEQCLLDLPLPLNLHSVFSNDFSLYEDAISRHDYRSMSLIEASVRRELTLDP